jgi:hypothetical protein
MATKREVYRAGVIEEPGRYDTLARWEAHLAKMKAMEIAPGAPYLRRMVRSAQEISAQKKRHLREFNANLGKRT